MKRKSHTRIDREGRNYKNKREMARRAKVSESKDKKINYRTEIYGITKC